MKPLRLRSKLTRLPAQDQCQTTKFDEATGQVYTETTAAIQCSDDSDWTQWRYRQTTVGSAPAGGNDQELQINDARPSKINPRVGPRSLQDCAIRCLLQHISDVTVEMIDSLPLTVRYRVWDAVTRRLVGLMLQQHLSLNANFGNLEMHCPLGPGRHSQNLSAVTC